MGQAFDGEWGKGGCPRWINLELLLYVLLDSVLLMEDALFVVEKRMTKFLGDVFVWHILIVILFKITELYAGVENVKAEQER